MLNSVIENEGFALVMQQNIQNLIIHFFEVEQNFGILCNITDVSFEPELPEDIASTFRQMTLFFLAGYTFESARLEGDYLVFEAGFGAENFGSVVSVPLLSILQVIIDETPVLINLANYKKRALKPKKDVDESGVENSMASFLSNPENSKFLK